MAALPGVRDGLRTGLLRVDNGPTLPARRGVAPRLVLSGVLLTGRARLALSTSVGSGAEPMPES